MKRRMLEKTLHRLACFCSLFTWQQAVGGYGAGMISSSQLTDSQRASLQQWAEEGATMQDLQKKMNEQWGLRVTYMDTRLLVLDMNLVLKSPAKVEETAKPVSPLDPHAAAAPAAAGGFHVSLDTLTLPGTLFSGKVTFSDGEQALWYVDQTGRLGLDPSTPGYRPSPEDIVAFQSELKRLVR